MAHSTTKTTTAAAVYWYIYNMSIQYMQEVQYKTRILYSCLSVESKVCNNNLIHQINHLIFSCLLVIFIFFVLLSLLYFLVVWFIFGDTRMQVCQVFLAFIYSFKMTCFSLPQFPSPTAHKICVVDIFHYNKIETCVFFMARYLRHLYTSSVNAIYNLMLTFVWCVQISSPFSFNTIKYRTWFVWYPYKRMMARLMQWCIFALGWDRSLAPKNKWQ